MSEKRRKSSTSPEQVVVEAIVKGVVHLFRALFKIAPKNSLDSASVARIKNHWQSVELHLLHENTRALAVSEADKLLDAALQAKGFGGDSMGERLKMAQSYFPPALYQAIWDAHKLRNHLAHEIGAAVGAREAEGAVDTFRQALTAFKIL